MKIASPRPQRKARIEIVPLIDIIFFLLATFVMVSLSMVKNQGIALQLPVAKSSEPQERKDYISLSVTEAGEFFIDKKLVRLEELKAELLRIKETSPDPKIFINGDTRARFGDAVTALDEARRAGITKVAIETRKKE